MSEAFKKFREKAQEVTSKYLKPSDIEETRRLKVIPWLLNSRLTTIHFFYEGWQEIREKGKSKPSSKPIRFPINDEGGYDLDNDDIVWAKSEYGGLQKPVPCFVAIVADFHDETIKVFSGTQKTLVGPISEMFDPDSERFVKNWSKVDLIISKDNKKFTVERDKLDDEVTPEWIIKELEGFSFSLEKFLDSEKQEEGEGTTYQEVLEVLEDKAPVEKKEKEPVVLKNNYVEGWEKVKTPRGKLLGECSLEELKTYKKTLDGSEKTDKKGKLYLAILSGINDHDEAASIEQSDDVAF